MQSGILDLHTQLAFYKSYHSDTVNVLIHSIFVPSILFSSMLILNHVPLTNGFTLSHALVAVFSLYYIALHRIVGSLAFAILALAQYSIDASVVAPSLKTSWAIFCTGWIFQFIGHGVFERRRPALIDNLVQSLVAAPFFILFESLFLLGFFPQLNEELEKEARRLKGKKQ